MAQKRTNYSKSTGSNGTIQVLMLWASIALHLLIGSNLGLFGRLDPIKVKPAGGTVRVVDLTPAEQTRVPEAAKSKPLPIAPIPVNPEPATRNSTPPSLARNPGAYVPPRNQPQSSPPSSQVPVRPSTTQTPVKLPPVSQPPISTNPNSKKPELSAPDPKKQRAPQPSDSEDNNTQAGNNKKSGDRRASKPSTSDIDQNSTNDKNNPPLNRDNKRDSNIDRNRDESNNNTGDSDSLVTEQSKLNKEVNDAVKSLKKGGIFPAKNIRQLIVPGNLLQISPTQKYRPVAVIWPTDSSGELQDLSPIILPNKRSEYSFEGVAKTVKEAYNQLSAKERSALKDSTLIYQFKIPY